MTFPLVFNKTTAPTRGPSLGAISLRNVLMDEFGCTNLGIYNNRSVRGGSSLSRHAAGAAFDGGFVYKVGGRPEGWNMANWLLANHRALGVQQIIYARRIWSNYRDSEGWRYYGGTAAHYEHVHVELTDQASRELTEHRIRKELFMNSNELPSAAVETLLVNRVKLAYELFPNRDPNINGLRYWAGQLISTYRAGGDPDVILNHMELGLLSELSPAEQVALSELVTDSKG